MIIITTMTIITATIIPITTEGRRLPRRRDLAQVP